MTSSMDDINSEVSTWLRETFKKENFAKIDIEIVGSPEKGDGYSSDIRFVNATALTSNGETKKINLVIKRGKHNEALPKNVPVRLAFEREIFVYGTVVPAFKQFENRRNVKLLDSFLPKCFNTLLYENDEVLILQNLKAIGYELHDRFQPLDINHLKMTFENYGKWHGFSLAYRDQKPEQFKEVFENLEFLFEKFITLLRDILKQAEPALYVTLEDNNEFEIIKTLRKRFTKGFLATFEDLLKVEEANGVFLHADCWNNNLMFKYDDVDKTQPTALKFLDFQASWIGSPVFDLSYHLYSTASKKELIQFKSLLQIYYSSLSSTIKSLGSDSEKLFPYCELIRQWKAYSSFGVVMGTLVLPGALASKEDVIDIQNCNEEQMAEMVKNVRQKSNDQLSSRYIAMVKHFLYFKDF